MALNPATMLNNVETLITAITEGGHSSYSIGSRTVTKLDLPALFAERRLLIAEVNRASSGAIRVAKMVRPRQ